MQTLMFKRACEELRRLKTNLNIKKSFGGIEVGEDNIDGRQKDGEKVAMELNTSYLTLSIVLLQLVEYATVMHLSED